MRLHALVIELSTMSEVPKPGDNPNTSHAVSENPVVPVPGVQEIPVTQGESVTQVVQMNEVTHANTLSPANADQNVTKSKSKKKKNKLGVAAPRPPLTGYVRYLNSRRENLKNENPNLTFPDITKILAQEWANLSPEEKQPYLDAGVQDRERWLQEMEVYKGTENYRNFRRQQEEKQKAKETSKEPVREPEEKRIKIASENGQRVINGFDIPIFTDEFLELNRAREAELRQLRRNSSDFELQNASLSRIVESMRTAVDGLEVGIKGRRDSNLSIIHHLDRMRASLAAAFHAVALPDSGARATVDTVDDFMLQLHGLLTGGESSKHFQLLARVAGILDRLEIQS